MHCHKRELLLTLKEYNAQLSQVRVFIVAQEEIHFAVEQREKHKQHKKIQ